MLTDGYYTSQMDMWGIGCVFFEMLSLYPLFPGEKNEIDQIEKIFGVLGSPSKHLLEKWKKLASHINFDFPKRKKGGKAKSISKMLSHVSIECVDLIEKLLKYDPEERVTSTNARNHPYFKEIRELEMKSRYRQGAPKRNRDRGDRENSYDKYKKNRSNYSSDSSVGSNHKQNINYINININAPQNVNSSMNVSINLKNQKKKRHHDKKTHKEYKDKHNYYKMNM